MSYFDGIKVGDTIYHWEKPETVIQVDDVSFKVGVMWYSIHIDPCVIGRFWQPVPKPIPPPRPKKMVKKYLCLWRMIGEKDWKINKNHKDDQLLYDTKEKALCAYENQESTYAEVWIEEETK